MVISGMCEHTGSVDHFKYRRLLDQLKNELCREKGVLLLRIPDRCISDICTE